MTLEGLRPTMLALNEVRKDFTDTELYSVIDLTLAKISDYANLVHTMCQKYEQVKTEAFIAYEEKTKEIISTIVSKDENGEMLVRGGEYVVDTKLVSESQVNEVNEKLNKLYHENKSIVDSYMIPTRVMYKYANEVEMEDEDVKYIFSQNVSTYIYKVSKEKINDIYTSILSEDNSLLKAENTGEMTDGIPAEDVDENGFQLKVVK